MNDAEKIVKLARQNEQLHALLYRLLSDLGGECIISADDYSRDVTLGRHVIIDRQGDDVHMYVGSNDE